MSAFFSNPEYNYSYLETSDYENMSRSSYYGMQPSNTYSVRPQKESELDHNMYEYPNMIPETSIPERSYVPEIGFLPQSTQYMGQSDMLIQRPPVLSWPMEYFAPTGAELTSRHFEPISPTSTLTPDLMYTSSLGSACSMDETSNVFDMHFGAAVGSPNSFSNSNNRQLQYSSSGSSGSPSPLSDSHEPIRSSRRSPIRTPSPSETSSNSDHRRRFPCLLVGCTRRFTSQYTLKVHMEAHKPKPKVSFPCTHGCNERFSRQHDRLRHEVAKHGKICEFSCEDCGRFFSTSKTLSNHKCPLAQGGTRWVHS